jgi:glycosyltransferase involved in cell wall biosynthesis
MGQQPTDAARGRYNNAANQKMNVDVSIVLFTYNHGAFVAQAIESVLAQERPFSHEIIIADDASTDDTAAVIERYRLLAPDTIRPIINTRNQGEVQFVDTLTKARGAYIALLEGDDYWTDSRKLVKQLDFLRARPDYTLCGHNCHVRNEWNGKQEIRVDGARDLDLTVPELLRSNRIPTGSMFFRAGLIPEWPREFFRVGFDDWPLQIMLAQRGRVRFLAESMLVYRVHSGGHWSGKYSIPSERAKPAMKADGWNRICEFWDVLRGYLGEEFHELLDALIESKRRELAETHGS